jgi:hypothetical protein
MSSKLAQRTPQKVKLQFHLGETCATPKHRPPSSSTAIMAAPKKERNNHHTEIWESTIAYKDAFCANEPGRRKR